MLQKSIILNFSKFKQRVQDKQAITVFNSITNLLYNIHTQI